MRRTGAKHDFPSHRPFSRSEDDTIVEAVRTRSVHRNQTEWQEVEPAFRARAAQAGDEDSTAQAVVFLYEPMGDLHGHWSARGRPQRHFKRGDQGTARRLRPLASDHVCNVRSTWVRLANPPSNATLRPMPIDNTDYTCGLKHRLQA